MKVHESGASIGTQPLNYTPARDGESLQLGTMGPSVSQLQQKLNALGAKPPLAVDGKFGPKTEAALQKLLGSAIFDESTAVKLEQKLRPQANAVNVFVANSASSFGAPTLGQSGAQTMLGGSDAPATVPMGQVAAANAVGAQAPAGGVAARVVDQARAEDDSINPMKAGDDGHYKGWKQLQTVFEQTTGWKPSDKECQTITPGRGVLPGGKSWCGVWACHIYQQAGVNVKWDLTKGQMVGDVTRTLAPSFSTPAQYKAERSAFEQSIKPGDVITLNGKTNHHAIVVNVNADGTVDTIDGNKPMVGHGHYPLANVTSFYRPNNAE